MHLDTAEKSTNRNSAIELLKIIAMFLIVMDHVQTGAYNNSFGYDPSFTTRDFGTLLYSMTNCFGNVGNAIFIFCSCWFLLESKKAKFNKIKHIIIDQWIISIAFLVVHFIAGIPERISLKEIYYSVLPTITGVNWFVTCYVLFYVIHPYINVVIANMKDKELKIAALSLTALYGVISIILPRGGSGLYFTGLVGFIMYYFIVAYIKRFNLLAEKRICFLILIGCIGLIFVGYAALNYAGLQFVFLQNKLQYFNAFTNPVFVLIAYSLFGIFSRQELGCIRWINALSKCSLLCFIIHNNYFVKTYDRSLYYVFVHNRFGIGMGFASGFAGSVMTFVISMALALLYLNIKNIIVKRYMARRLKN